MKYFKKPEQIDAEKFDGTAESVKRINDMLLPNTAYKVRLHGDSYYLFAKGSPLALMRLECYVSVKGAFVQTYSKEDFEKHYESCKKK